MFVPYILNDNIIFSVQNSFEYNNFEENNFLFLRNQYPPIPQQQIFTFILVAPERLKHPARISGCVAKIAEKPCKRIFFVYEDTRREIFLSQLISTLSSSNENSSSRRFERLLSERTEAALHAELSRCGSVALSSSRALLIHNNMTYRASQVYVYTSCRVDKTHVNSGVSGVSVHCERAHIQLSYRDLVVAAAVAAACTV